MLYRISLSKASTYLIEISRWDVRSSNWLKLPKAKHKKIKMSHPRNHSLSKQNFTKNIVSPREPETVKNSQRKTWLWGKDGILGANTLFPGKAEGEAITEFSDETCRHFQL